MKIMGILLFAMTLPVPVLSEDVYAPDGRFLGEQIEPSDKIVTPAGWAWQGMSTEYSPTRKDGVTHSTVFYRCVCATTGRIHCVAFGRDNPNADGDSWHEWGWHARVYALGTGIYTYQTSSDGEPHGNHVTILQISEDGKRLTSSLAVGKGITDHTEFSTAEKVRVEPSRWRRFIEEWNAAGDGAVMWEEEN